MASPGQVDRPVATRYRLSFHGTGGGFLFIFLKNVLLSLVTLGVYLAWAKAERRRYVWSNLHFHDQPFRYTGTGLEIFKGYVVVVAAYGVFLGIPALIERFVSPSLGVGVQVALAFGIFLAVPLLIFRSRGFLYNRSVWRSIRFGLAPNAGRYARTFWAGSLLTVLTLGLYSPVMTNRLHRVLTESTRFGSLEFAYEGSDREAFWLGLKGLVLTVLTLGIYSFWYRAELRRFQFAHTRVGEGARLCSHLSGADFFLLFLIGVVGTTLTLGLAFPWIAMYSIGLLANGTSVEGTLDFEAIEQRERESGAVSDGFADAFDVDLGL